MDRIIEEMKKILNNKILDYLIEKDPTLYIQFMNLYIRVKEELLKDIAQIILINNNFVIGEQEVPYYKMLLNDHGEDHIVAVFDRASEFVILLEKNNLMFSGEELYMLSVSILFHDMGNMSSRKGHEKQYTYIKKYEKLITSDRFEFKAICDIINAHGGYFGDDRNKDKITYLQTNELIKNKYVRMRVLASILRLADELAENSTRTSDILFQTGVIPEGSILYHTYSSIINGCRVNENKRISIHYTIEEELLKKEISGVYLIDELYTRLLKLHNEKIYCMRFLRKYFDIDEIEVSLSFISDKTDEYYSDIDDMIFSIFEVGYPEDFNDIYSLCPSLKKGDQKLNGVYYNDLITKRGESNDKKSI